MIRVAKLSNNKVVNVIIVEKLGDLPSVDANNYIPITDQTGQADMGYTYDPARGVFVEPAPYASWTYNYTDKKWVPPVPVPSDYGPVKYVWDEASQSWVVYTPPSNPATV